MVGMIHSIDARPSGLSVVVPVYRSEAILTELVQRLEIVLSRITSAYELVLAVLLPTLGLAEVSGNPSFQNAPALGIMAEVLWLIFVIVLPFLGVFIYLIGASKGMAERSIEDAHHEVVA